MKSRFLDSRNCHALLPAGHGLSALKRLENCLAEINDRPGDHQGAIDRLVSQNTKTANSRRGSKRLCQGSIDISLWLNVPRREIRTQARVRTAPGPSELHFVLDYEDRLTWKTIVPLQYVLKGWGDANDGYQCYIHTIAHDMPRIATVGRALARQATDQDDYYYVGITKRNWLKRLSEHLGEARRGSRIRFHQALQQCHGVEDVLIVSALRGVNLTFEEAMNWEERKVDEIASDQHGLNMIPGGFKGLRFLHKHSITNRVDITFEEREKAIEEFVRLNPRKGIPNPLMSALWADDDFYLRNIGARKKTLSPEQVKEIRQLASEGQTAAEITGLVGALHERQVKDVISGKTYKRMR